MISVMGVVGCSSGYMTWVYPKGKTEQNFYADKNACQAEAIKVTKSILGDYWVDCMKAKGYKQVWHQ